MIIINFIMGLVAAILIATGIQKEDSGKTKEKEPYIEVIGKPNEKEQIFTFENVRKKAQDFLMIPYSEPKKISNEMLSSLDYDKYKNIRFLPEKSVWREEGNPFQLQFLHQGYIYRHGVLINELRSGRARIISYKKDMFDFSQIPSKGKVHGDMNFSGFKIHYPINTEEHTDEFAVFQGASYFRVVSEKQVYGLSARGIAVNTAMPYPEEFPIFREFWVEKPKKGSDSINIFALMDGISVVGAYRFEFIPGKTTVTKVHAEITLRKKVDRLGIAPLTSMFWYGENSGALIQKSNPEVHDSDGLLILNQNGEWIWRPLDNPKRPTVNTFASENPKGFGLIQRDREFSSYEDQDMKYHLRPSAWIVPGEDWGKGTVQLYRMPTKSDTEDNVVAFWVPDVYPELNVPYNFSYTIYWVNEKPEGKSNADTVATRIKTLNNEPDSRIVQIDFKGEKLSSESKLEANVSGSENSEISDVGIQKIEETDKWRLSYKVKNKTPNKPMELRASLKDKDNEKLTEDWTYTFEF